MKSFDDILNRNHRVELDKAWEGSKTRRGIIAGVTYIVAAAFMKSIGVDAFLLNALVPTGGYLFSTLSLAIVKDWWIQREESSSEPDLDEVTKQDD
ncbi:MAG: hypothetical protein ACI92I_000923 [Acidimicrobiales bacterium]|jgi:hypothetical protein